MMAEWKAEKCMERWLYYEARATNLDCLPADSSCYMSKIFCGGKVYLEEKYTKYILLL